jgi:hypothetical protein
MKERYAKFGQGLWDIFALFPHLIREKRANTTIENISRKHAESVIAATSSSFKKHL